MREAPGPDDRPATTAPAGPFRLLLDMQERWGDVVRYQTAYGPTYFVSGPDHYRRVLSSGNFERTGLMRMNLGESLLAGEGDYWQAQRRAIGPTLQPRRIPEFGASVVREARAARDAWLRLVDAGRETDAARDLNRLALLVAGHVLMGVDLSERADELAAAFTTWIREGGRLAQPLFGLDVPVDPGQRGRLAEATAVVDRELFRIVRSARDGEIRTGVLEALVSAVDVRTARPLSDQQIRDELASLLVGGHESTAISLAWAFVLLARNPDAERRLHAELDAVLEGRDPEVADLEQLRFARAVWAETLRLYPAAWFQVRAGRTDDELGGFRIPARSPVVVSTYALHRHPAHWQRPEAFEPERFLGGAEGPNVPKAYVPFGVGGHRCVGAEFASLEGPLVLATLARNVRLRVERPNDVEPEPLLTLRLRGGLRATPERRGS